ncbi:MAG: type III secretion system chaperone [Rhabdochlamydiaceae bacterium]|nr:type III secretion system chaperone [Rhabdochlamydiaceae bacterium]
MLEQHLKRLFEDLELSAAVIKGEDDGYTVPLNDTLKVEIKELDPGLSFYTVLGALPTAKKEELFIYLMKANFLGQGTGGGTIALDDEEKFLTLSLVLPYDMNYITFKEALEDFVNYAEYWKRELLRHQKSSEDSILT